MTSAAATPDTEPVTTMFARRVHPDHHDQYERWLTGISRCSSGYAGNMGTTILRPGGKHGDYVAITHFESEANRLAWMESDDRQQWLTRLESISVQCERVDSLAGMESWFTVNALSDAMPPPRYKTGLMVLLGLYPTAMALGIVLEPLLAELPRPLALLVSLSCSVTAMVWFVLPLLTRLFRPWLNA